MEQTAHDENRKLLFEHQNYFSLWEILVKTLIHILTAFPFKDVLKLLQKIALGYRVLLIQNILFPVL